MKHKAVFEYQKPNVEENFFVLQRGPGLPNLRKLFQLTCPNHSLLEAFIMLSGHTYQHLPICNYNYSERLHFHFQVSDGAFSQIFTKCESQSVVYDSLQPHVLQPTSSSVQGILQAEYWSGQPFPSPGDFPDPGIKLRAPALQVDSLPSEPGEKP